MQSQAHRSDPRNITQDSVARSNAIANATGLSNRGKNNRLGIGLLEGLVG